MATALQVSCDGPYAPYLAHSNPIALWTQKATNAITTGALSGAAIVVVVDLEAVGSNEIEGLVAGRTQIGLLLP